MARPALLRIFIDDLPIKILSMVLAVTLFVLVRNDKDATSGAYVKVVYTMPPDEVLVSDPVSEVKVSVRGAWTQLQHLDRSLEPIRVDLAHQHGPELHFDEDMVRTPPGVRVTSIVPSDTHVELEPRVTRDVPVQPILEGQPAEGYRVSKVSAAPAKVHVDGPKSTVEAMERVPTRPLRVTDARGTITGEVALEAPPPHTRFDDVTSVLVRADVQPAMVEKAFEAMPVHIVGLSRMDATAEPPTARLVLRGPSPLVGDISDKSVTLKIDASLIDTRPPSKYTRAVTVSGLPAGVAAEVQPATVVLTTRHKRE